MMHFAPNISLSGILTPDDFNSLIEQIAERNHGIRNVAIFYLNHFADVRSRHLVKLRLRDLEACINGIYNPDLKMALSNYITFRKDTDVIYNNERVAFISQKGMSFTADTVRCMVKNVYKSMGYNDCLYSTGHKSELWVAHDRLLFEALVY